MLLRSNNYKLICFDDIVKKLFVKVYNENDDFLLSIRETQTVYDEMHSVAKSFLQKGENVVLESMYFEKHRQQAIEVAKKLNVEYKIIEIICEEKTIKERLKIRHKNNPQSPGFELYQKYKKFFLTKHRDHVIIDTSNKTPEETYIEFVAQLKFI